MSTVRPQISHSDTALQVWLVRSLYVFVCLVLIYRIFSLINTYAVNILFSDQWDIYNPLFWGQGWWELFNYQHGPHRQGVGGLVLGITAHLTNWNTRADAFVVGTILVLAMLAALWLKYRLFAAPTFTDVIIPLIFLTTAQFESLVITPNPAHGAVPVLLVVLFALAWTIPQNGIRYTAIAVLNVLLIYTGFGIFMGLITPAVLVLDAIHRWKDRENNVWLPLFTFMLGLASLYAFSREYRFAPAISCFSFPHERPLEYVWFVGLMFARFFGVNYTLTPRLAMLVGIALFAAILGVVLYHGLRVLRQGLRTNQTSLIITMLLGYTLIYAANTAIGRVCNGIEGGQSSRYMTLVIPAFFALYLYLCSLKPQQLQIAGSIIYVSLLLGLPFFSGPADVQMMQGFTNGKQQWRECYLAERDITQCDQFTGFKVYPSPNFQDKLDYLQHHRLSFFAEP
jgi:hypothetical protein